MKKSNLKNNVYGFYAVYYPTENIYSVPFFAMSFSHAKQRIYNNVVTGCMPDLLYKKDTELIYVGAFNFEKGMFENVIGEKCKIFDIKGVKDFYDEISANVKEKSATVSTEKSKGDI